MAKASPSREATVTAHSRGTRSKMKIREAQARAKPRRESAQPQVAKRKRESAQPQIAKRKRESAQPQMTCKARIRRALAPMGRSLNTPSASPTGCSLKAALVNDCSDDRRRDQILQRQKGRSRR